MRLERGPPGVVLLLVLVLASCSPSAHGTGTARHGHHLSAERSSSRSSNPPRIEYLLVLDAHGKPRTYFHSGNTVGFRLEVYSTAGRLTAAPTRWQMRLGSQTVRNWTHTGLRGPSRGHLFRAVQTVPLPTAAKAGTYNVRATVTVQGRTLSRSVRFYVRA